MQLSGDVEWARQWLEYAESDLASAEWLSQAPDPAVTQRNVYWLCQQAAEKAIKALLLAYDLPIEYTHNLYWLSTLLPKESSIHGREGLKHLSELGLESRYPDQLPELQATAEIEVVLELAREIVSLAKAEMARPR
jgi:HEPN domain-containing protein